MAIAQTFHNKLESWWIDINGQSVPTDHVLQIDLFAGVGLLGEPGKLIMTAQAFRLLDQQGMAFNPVGKTIEFILKDPKSGERPYSGVITSVNRLHEAKQDIVILGFDKPHWIKLNKVRWWKCFENKNILEITKEFFESQNVPFNIYPENHEKLRGTHWENFCTPKNGPTLPYLVEELNKDNFVFFANPEDGGIVIVNWSDITRLDAVCLNFPDYVVDQDLAKFDQTNDVWKKNTFTYGKQIDTHLPFRIQEVQTSFEPDINDNLKHQHVWYSGLKKPLQFSEDTSELEGNDIGLKEVEEYAGIHFDEIKVQPYPVLDDLVDQEEMPTTDYGEFEFLNQSITHPRYMYYRMQQSYARKLKLASLQISIPGSVKMVVPMSAVPVSYYENARVENPDENAKGDVNHSGLFLIWASKLSVVGPNAMLTLNLVKPYH